MSVCQFLLEITVLKTSKHLREVVMKWFIAAALVLSFAFGCSKGDDKETILQAVKNSVEMLNQENVEGYKALLTPEGPLAEQSGQLTEVFKVYDLYTTLENMRVIKSGKDKVSVEAILSTKKKAGPEFVDNKRTVIYHLLKKDDNWLIDRTDTIKQEALGAAE